MDLVSLDLFIVHLHLEKEIILNIHENCFLIKKKYTFLHGLNFAG